jgi:Flp pilus assembly protein TadD
MMELGRNYAALGSMNKATQAFARVAKIAPERADGWASLGTSLDRISRHLDAQTAYMKALAIEPNRTSTLTNYGLSLALIGNLAEAEAQLIKAAAQPDADLRVRENLALIQGLSGDYESMAQTSGKHAPTGIVENNVEALRAMIQPTRTWESLAQTADLGAVPQPASPIPALPANREAPKTAKTQAVGDESIGLVGEAEPKPSTSSGLRLRRN